MITSYKAKMIEYKALNDFYLEMVKAEKNLTTDYNKTHDKLITENDAHRKEKIEEHFRYVEAQKRIISDILNFIENEYK